MPDELDRDEHNHEHEDDDTDAGLLAEDVDPADAERLFLEACQRAADAGL
jgi:hypothetical protein